MNVTPTQAIDVWVELEACRSGTNSHAGDTAEIYAYRLMPSSPSYFAARGGPIFQEDHTRMERDAGVALRDLLDLFAKTYDHKGVGVQVGGSRGGKPAWVPICQWNRRGNLLFTHRIHVRVVRRRRRKKNTP